MTPTSPGLLVGLLVLSCVAFASCFSSTNPLRVLVTSDTPLKDFGWTYEHNRGRLALEWQLPRLVKTTLNISEPPSASPLGREIMYELAASGRYDMIISAGFTSLVETADSFPHMFFLGVDKPDGQRQLRPNLSYIYGKIEQMRYATGVLVGLMMAASNNQTIGSVGYLGSTRVAEVYRGINAFYSGLRSVWPQGVVKVFWTNTFSDPDLSAYATNVLIDDHGAVVITHHMNDLEALDAAAQRGLWSLGYQSDQGQWVSNDVLTSCVWNWSSTYLNFTQQALHDINNNGNNGAKEWQSGDFFLPVSSGVAGLGTWSPLVPLAIREQVEGVMQSMVNGSFDIFCGAEGDLWRTNATTGDCLSPQDLYAMLSFYPEIVDLGNISIPLTLVTVSSGLRAAMQTLAALGLASSVALAVLVVVYRESNVIRYSSPLFCCTMLFGAMLNYASVFVLSVDPTHTGECNAVWWLLCVGFGTFYAALLVKTWRVAEIFRHLKHLRSKAISNRTLMLFTAFVVALEIVLLVLLTAIDMPYAAKIRSNKDSSLGPYEYRVVCQQTQASEAVLWTLVAYNGVLLAAGVLLSFQTRSLSKTFNESKHIAAGIYAFSAMLAICVPLVAISGSDYVTRYWITALGIILSTTTAVFALFVPKFFIVFSGLDANFHPFQHSLAQTPDTTGAAKTSSNSRTDNSSLNFTTLERDQITSR